MVIVAQDPSSVRMALGGSGFLQNPTLLEQLLEEINFQRTKEMRQLLKDDSGFVVLQGTTYWTDLFVRHFLFQEDKSIDCDDLLFFVRKRHAKGSPRYLPKYETEVEVFRKDSKKLPIGDPDVDWEETVYLNLVVHQFDYTLTLAVCTRTSPKELQVLKRHSQKVYASPSRRKMDTKGDSEDMTYPHICFCVDNFDEVLCEMAVRDGEMVCVELVARGRSGSAQAVLFLGSIRYDALSRVYDSRQSSLSTKVAQRMSFGLLSGTKSGAARCEFVRMKGPAGKGHAEMAVSKPRGSGVETPTSEPGLCAVDVWDSDWDDDPEDFYVYRHQRRLSDPSANIHTFSRGGWRTRSDAKDKSRSENEGLDCMANGVAEVEAGDLRDERARSDPASSGRRVWGRCCAAPAVPADMGEVYVRHDAPPYDPSTPHCLRIVTPKRGLRSGLRREGACEREGLQSENQCESERQEYEVAADAVALDDEKLTRIRTTTKRSARSIESDVRGHEELPCLCCDTDEVDVESGTTPGVESCATSDVESGATRDVESGATPDVERGATSDVDGGATSDVDGGAGGGARSYCTLPRKHRGVASALYKNARFPPRKTTPDGTDIYYWCDMPKRKKHELDDGAYNPLWAMRGFTQTFHLWKEGKRAQSAPLHAFVTYVTLPWWSIAKDILDHREEPILTF